MSPSQHAGQNDQKVDAFIALLLSIPHDMGKYLPYKVEYGIDEKAGEFLSLNKPFGVCEICGQPVYFISSHHCQNIHMSKVRKTASPGIYVLINGFVEKIPLLRPAVEPQEKNIYHKGE